MSNVALVSTTVISKSGAILNLYEAFSSCDDEQMYNLMFINSDGAVFKVEQKIELVRALALISSQTMEDLI